MIYLYLFITFFEIGLFGFGGGYGMLSLIQHETVEHWHWLTASQFTDIVAISQMTPGPIGINSATYCGYTAVVNAGHSMPMAILGSATATFALVLPSLILMVLISKMFMKYMHTHTVESVFRGLRPAVVGLLAAATLLLMTPDNFSTPKENPWQFGISCMLFAAAFYGVKILKINPIRMICYCALAGLVLLY
ncbi:MAG: chromate transporter [Prevotella sp.]|nr:chromate transporter [Prevotella sp.]MBQ9202769.1 chromate transporter [Prevotella sp.]